MAYKKGRSEGVNDKHTGGRASKNNIERQPLRDMALNRLNFILMAAAGVMIVVGFLLMLGPSATVENYEPDIFSTRRIVVGPLIAFLGFVAMAVAIIVTPRRKKDEAAAAESEQ